MNTPQRFASLYTLSPDGRTEQDPVFYQKLRKSLGLLLYALKHASDRPYTLIDGLRTVSYRGINERVMCTKTPKKFVLSIYPFRLRGLSFLKSVTWVPFVLYAMIAEKGK